LTLSFVAVLVLVLAAYVAIITPTLSKLFRRCSADEISPEWLERFSARSYYPMDRLLSPEDFSFLSRQPGFDLSLYRKFRRDRLCIFRQYLSRMICDFNRLHLTARLLVANGTQDHSELLTKLIWLKVRFSLAVLQAEFRYFLCCLGVRTLSVRVLILRLEELSAQVGAISAAETA
jgi:hypothetical protein